MRHLRGGQHLGVQRLHRQLRPGQRRRAGRVRPGAPRRRTTSVSTPPSGCSSAPGSSTIRWSSSRPGSSNRVWWSHGTIRAGRVLDDPRLVGRTVAVRCGSCAAPSRFRRSSRSVSSWPRTASIMSGWHRPRCSATLGERSTTGSRVASTTAWVSRSGIPTAPPTRHARSQNASSIIVAARSYLTDDEPAIDTDTPQAACRALRLDRPLRAAARRPTRRRPFHPARRPPCGCVRRRQLDRRPGRGAPRRPRLVRQERQPAPPRCRQLVRPGLDRHHRRVRADRRRRRRRVWNVPRSASTAVRPGRSSPPG